MKRGLVLFVVLIGCGRMEYETGDAGSGRADGSIDAALAPPIDAGDAGELDAAAPDGGDVDAGGTDAGGTDAGGTDAGGTDAGGTDASGSDAAGSDAGSIDGGGISFTCPRPYATVPSTGLVSGDFSAATANDTGSCGGDLSADFVYAVPVEVSGTELLVATDLPATTADTIAYVRSDCTVGASEVGCDNDSGLTTGAVVRTGGLAAGPYYVFIDQNDSRNRSFEASIELLLPAGAACDPASATARCGPELACVGGVCAAAGCMATESFSGTGVHTTLAQTTVGQPNVHAGGCSDGGIRSPERVYEVVLTAAVTSIRVTTDDAMTTYDTLVYVRNGCTGAEVGCDDDTGAGTTSTLATGPLPAGTYYVFVDGFGGASGIPRTTIEVVP